MASDPMADVSAVVLAEITAFPDWNLADEDVGPATVRRWGEEMRSRAVGALLRLLRIARYKQWVKERNRGLAPDHPDYYALQRVADDFGASLSYLNRGVKLLAEVEANGGTLPAWMVQASGPDKAYVELLDRKGRAVEAAKVVEAAAATRLDECVSEGATELHRDDTASCRVPRMTLLREDCLMALRGLHPGSANLIVTSPPYADRRSEQYPSVSADEYVDWFLQRSALMREVLANDGTLIINIKEHVVEGERHTYVLDLIRALRGQGWLWTEEFIWHKANSTPGYWPNRFRDSWERVLQFNKQRAFAMYQDEVAQPVGDWASSRLRNISETDGERRRSATGSGFAAKVDNWVGRETALPDNVLHMATECGNTGHSAAFPVAIPDFFVRLFSKPGDVVLDPFCGSGTTGEAALLLGRSFIGIDIDPKAIDIARARIEAAAVKGRAA